MILWSTRRSNEGGCTTNFQTSSLVLGRDVTSPYNTNIIHCENASIYHKKSTVTSLYRFPSDNTTAGSHAQHNTGDTKERFIHLMQPKGFLPISTPTCLIDSRGLAHIVVSTEGTGLQLVFAPEPAGGWTLHDITVIAAAHGPHLPSLLESGLELSELMSLLSDTNVDWLITSDGEGNGSSFVNALEAIHIIHAMLIAMSFGSPSDGSDSSACNNRGVKKHKRDDAGGSGGSGSSAGFASGGAGSAGIAAA